MKCNQCGTEFEGKFCPNCGASVETDNVTQQTGNVQPTQQTINYNQAPIQPVAKAKKPIFKKWWFWVIVVVVVIVISANLDDNNDKTDNASNNTSGTVSTVENNDSTKTDASADNNKKVTVVDFSAMDQAAIQSWADANKITCKFSEDYSDLVAKGLVVSQSKNAGETIKEGTTINVVISRGKKQSLEYLNALAKAETYSKTMYMSKKGIYDQLTSEYGEKFPADAAQYAIDNMSANWNENALQKAKIYQESMNMSKNAIYDQLISEYGEKFTKEEAQYAIDHLDD